MTIDEEGYVGSPHQYKRQILLKPTIINSLYTGGGIGILLWLSFQSPSQIRIAAQCIAVIAGFFQVTSLYIAFTATRSDKDVHRLAFEERNASLASYDLPTPDDSAEQSR